MSLPVVDIATAAPAAVLAAFQRHGAAWLVDATMSRQLSDRMLADARAFFALGATAKQTLATEVSPHHRGYSRMHNERDHREQIHFGRELPAVPAGAEQFWRLQGPNLWPDDPAWRRRVLAYMAAVEQLGHRLLARLATALELDPASLLGPDPYVLMKCIGYHRQDVGHGLRRGVAAHLDFSLVTLTLQDDTGGLAIRSPDGSWQKAPPHRGAWLATVGELLQFATGDRVVATPHRVVNPSLQHQRCSVPVFVNPSLATTLRRELPRVAGSGSGRPGPEGVEEHVHAVLDPASTGPSLHYGAAEWRRKGENLWCARCAGRGGATQANSGENTATPRPASG